VKSFRGILTASLQVKILFHGIGVVRAVVRMDKATPKERRRKKKIYLPRTITVSNKKNKETILK